MSIPLRTHAHLIAYLALAPKPRARDQVIQAIWPGVNEDSARNRLRVALTRLRGILSDGLVETEEGLSLRPDRFTCDAWELLDHFQQADECVSEREELEELIAALDSMGTGTNLLRWIALSPEFAAQIIDRCQRAVELALEFKDYLRAEKAAELGLTFYPGDVKCWIGLLTSMWRRGDGPEGLKRLKNAKVQEIGQDARIKPIVDQIRLDPTPQSIEVSKPRSRFVVELMASLLESRPDLCRPLLCAPQSLTLAGKYPLEMHDLLTEVVDKPDVIDEAWELCTARLIGLKAWLNDSQGVIELSDRVLPDIHGEKALRAIWNAVSMAHSYLRNWPEALAALETTKEYARRSGDPLDYLSAVANGAYFSMQRAQFEAATRIYDEVAASLAAIQSPRARFEEAILVGNRAFIPVLQGKWEIGLKQLANAIAFRQEAEFPIKIGLLQAALGLCRSKLGQFDGTAEMIRHSFLDAFATDSERDQQITFEFAAGAIAAKDAEFGLAVLDWIEEWRNRTSNVRGEAELGLCRILRAEWDFRGKVGSLTEGVTPTKLGGAIMRRLRSAFGGT